MDLNTLVLSKQGRLLACLQHNLRIPSVEGTPEPGAPYGAALCYLFIGVLNLIAIGRLVPQKPALIRNILRPALPAAVMGVAVWGVSYLMKDMLGITSRTLLCLGPVGVGAVVYLVCVVLFKAITAEDCALLPKGEKIAKLLKLR